MNYGGWVAMLGTEAHLVEGSALPCQQSRRVRRMGWEG